MKGKTTPEERTRALAFLRERYPQAFRLAGDIKPFEIGIRGKLVADIKDPLPEGISLRAIYVALHYYCCGKEYKKARRVLGNPRINLAGEVVGQVTPADLELGQQLNAKRKQIKAEKRARQQALEAKRREKENQTTETSKKAAKEADKKSPTSSKKGGKSIRGNKLSPTTDNHAKSTSSVNHKPTHQPTIIVRKRKNLNLPNNKEKS